MTRSLSLPLALWLCSVASGEVWFEVHELTAHDGAEDDRFGNAVAIDDGVAIIGSVWDDDDGSRSGSVYLFDTETGAQLAKLTASDATAGDWYGNSVDIDGPMALVGAQYAGDDSSEGAVYVIDVPTATELRRIALPDGVNSDEFGHAVALHGTTALIGARRRYDTGAAYLYDAATGELLHELVPPEANVNDRIGDAVALNGAWALVAASEVDGACPEVPTCDSGAVHVFNTATGAWVMTLESTNDDGDAMHDRFGWSVALDGDIASVGAPWDSEAATEAGATFRFDLSTGEPIDKLIHASAGQSDLVGWAVGAAGGTTYVGAPRYRFDVGFVFPFAADGTQLDHLNVGGSFSDFFGAALDVDGFRLVVGASGADAPEECRGRAFIFHRALDCDEDFDQDGSVGFGDLVLLLANWGPCNGCGEDLDDDGDVTFNDLLLLLSNWGPCI